jgi:hypothetical protein
VGSFFHDRITPQAFFISVGKQATYSSWTLATLITSANTSTQLHLQSHRDVMTELGWAGLRGLFASLLVFIAVFVTLSFSCLACCDAVAIMVINLPT